MGYLSMETDSFNEMANIHHVLNPVSDPYTSKTVLIVVPQGHGVTFQFQTDKLNILVNVQTLPDNIGPERDRSVTQKKLKSR